MPLLILVHLLKVLLLNLLQRIRVLLQVVVLQLSNPLFLLAHLALQRIYGLLLPFEFLLLTSNLTL